MSHIIEESQVFVETHEIPPSQEATLFNSADGSPCKPLSFIEDSPKAQIETLSHIREVEPELVVKNENKTVSFECEETLDTREISERNKMKLLEIEINLAELTQQVRAIDPNNEILSDTYCSKQFDKKINDLEQRVTEVEKKIYKSENEIVNLKYLCTKNELGIKYSISNQNNIKRSILYIAAASSLSMLFVFLVSKRK